MITDYTRKQRIRNKKAEKRTNLYITAFACGRSPRLLNKVVKFLFQIATIMLPK
jgi:hypothetical protein